MASPNRPPLHPASDLKPHAAQPLPRHSKSCVYYYYSCYYAACARSICCAGLQDNRSTPRNCPQVMHPREALRYSCLFWHRPAASHCSPSLSPFLMQQHSCHHQHLLPMDNAHHYHPQHIRHKSVVLISVSALQDVLPLVAIVPVALPAALQRAAP